MWIGEGGVLRGNNHDRGNAMGALKTEGKVKRDCSAGGGLNLREV